MLIDREYDRLSEFVDTENFTWHGGPGAGNGIADLGKAVSGKAVSGKIASAEAGSGPARVGSLLAAGSGTGEPGRGKATTAASAVRTLAAPVNLARTDSTAVLPSRAQATAPLAGFAAARYDRVHRVVAEGEFVYTLASGSLAGSPYAFHDLFRVHGSGAGGGFIVEHWDISTPVPPRLPHDNGMF